MEVEKYETRCKALQAACIMSRSFEWQGYNAYDEEEGGKLNQSFDQEHTPMTIIPFLQLAPIMYDKA